jgi:hypothetical protein
MTPEIVNKLGRFLDIHHPLTEECHAVYLLAEIRKLLDRENNKKAPLLRFYADWSVHTEKDRITPQIETTMLGILRNIRIGIAANTLDAGAILGPFVYMENLRAEFRTFLAHYGLPAHLADDGWLSFRNLLAAVLVDQPINDPCPGVHRFAFTRSTTGELVGELVYEKNPRETDTLAFG